MKPIYVSFDGINWVRTMLTLSEALKRDDWWVRIGHGMATAP